MHLSRIPQQKQYVFDYESADYGTVQVHVEITKGDWAKFTVKASGIIVWGMSHRGFVSMSEQDKEGIQDMLLDIVHAEKPPGYSFLLVLLQH